MADFKSRRLASFDAKLLAEPGHVVGEDGGFVAGTGDSDVTESGTEQIGVNTGIGMD